MRVGMDISQIAHIGGVEAYTQNLAENLQNISGLDMVFFYSSLRKNYKGNLKNVKKFRLPPTLFEVLFNKIRSIKIEKFIGPIEIFHSSDWVQPPTDAKKITTYHDVIPLLFPKWSHPKIVPVHKRRLEIVEKEIDCVIAVSRSTKNDLLRVSKIPETKIKVIYEGIDEIFKSQPPELLNIFKKKYDLPDEYILAIGGIGERKNIDRIKKASEDLSLVILGQTIDLPREELPLLYSAANVLVYPSLYEGFGLPILEAMACGTPVVTSNISSMPEVAGDAAVLINPESVEDIRKGIIKALKQKEELTIKGLARAKQFSWQKCAEETNKVYQGVTK